jgi:four helix bundle protein
VGDYEELRTYQLAGALGDELHARIRRWDSFDRWSLGRQLLRAIDSVAANIAEGCGRRHPREERQFLYVARGSLHETGHWVTRAIVRQLLPPETKARVDEIGRALNGQIAALSKGLATSD